VLLGCEDVRALVARDLDGNDLVLELPCGLRRREAVLRPECPLVLRLTSNLEFADQILHANPGPEDISGQKRNLEPSVPLVRPDPNGLKKARELVRKISRDACAPVKCANRAAILTIEWLDRGQCHARTLYRNHARRE
jgi:hypothetical protein